MKNTEKPEDITKTENAKKQKNVKKTENMNRIKYLKGSIYALTMLLFLLSLKAFQENSDFETYEKRFTLVAPLKWTPIAQGILDADAKFHTNTKLLCSESLNPDKQADEINAAVLEGTDGIITAATSDSQKLCDAIQNASDHGIPVVLIDSDLPESSRDVYIGSNNYKMGVLAAQDMILAAGEDLTVGIVISDLENPNQQQRVRGFSDEMRKYAGVKIADIFECHSDQLEILEKVPKLLQEYPEIHAFYLTEAFTSVVVGDILKETIQTSDLTVVATDDMEKIRTYISEGTYFSTIAQSPYEEGYLSVQILDEMTDGKEVEEYIFTDVFNIYKENQNKINKDSNGEQVWHFY